MIIGPIHRRYAKALFLLALEQELVDRVAEDLAGFNRVLKENKKLQVFLFSPEISRQKKLNLVKELGQDHFSGLFNHFLIFVVKRGRQIFLDGIDSEFQRLREAFENVLPATIATAFALDEEDKSNIIKSLEKLYQAKIKLESQVQEDLLGGMLLRLGDKVFDLTLKTQLNRLREKMLLREF